jgi:hypothetical protein
VNLAGYAMLVAGFLAAAFWSVTDETVVSWARYGSAMALGMAGVALLRRARRMRVRSAALIARNREHIDESLARVIGGLEAMTSGGEAVPPWELRFEIDRRFRDDLSRFADARETLAHIYGLSVYAEIMSAFAAGERYLNRVWSASADGYMDEAVAYLGRALGQFRDAAARLEAAKGAA